MRRSGPERGAFTVGAVAFGIAVAVVAVLAASLGDAPSLDALACVRFYLAYGCPP